MDPTPPALEVQSLNHWAIREVPQILFKVLAEMHMIECLKENNIYTMYEDVSYSLKASIYS